MSTSDFPNQESADAAADTLVKSFNEQFPEEAAKFPDQKVPGFPMLDTFWFGIHENTFLLIKEIEFSNPKAASFVDSRAIRVIRTFGKTNVAYATVLVCCSHTGLSELCSQ